MYLTHDNGAYAYRVIVHGNHVDIENAETNKFEISQKVIIDLAADRGAFIDQSQSLNIHIAAPTFPKLTSMHFYGWKKGLKTGMYYLRTRPAVDAIKFTVDTEALAIAEELENMSIASASSNFTSVSAKDPRSKQPLETIPVCMINNEGCISCSG